MGCCGSRPKNEATEKIASKPEATENTSLLPSATHPGYYRIIWIRFLIQFLDFAKNRKEFDWDKFWKKEDDRFNV
jgi:hypothetical protein